MRAFESDNRAHLILDEVQSLSDEFGLHSLNKTIRSIRNFADQNHYLDVAVLGQFKAGKSTFLNSYLNRNLLPVGSIPVTSVITRIKYGPAEKAAVTFEDGTVQEIEPPEMINFVSEQYNPENVKRVLLVDVETPTLQRFKNLRLVDTPGIGSVWRHNTETTASWFPETGGVLLLISSERPISESEVELMKEVFHYSPEITVVITKADLVEEEKLREIEAFTAEVLRKIFACDFPILRYSARVNPAPYNQAVEERCLQPLARNRDQVYARILRHKVNSLACTCLSYLEISHQASLQREAERQRLKSIILDQQLNSHYIRRELMLIVGSYKEKTRESLQQYLNTFRPGIEERVAADYQISFENWRGNLYHLSRQYEMWQKQVLEAELKEILASEEKSMELLSAVKEHLSFYLSSFRERLNQNLERLLGVQVKSEQWEIKVREFRRPSISVSRSFEFHLDMLWFLFPMFIFRNLFRRYFASKIPEEVEKNLHRLTSGLTEQVSTQMDDLMKQSLAYMNEELSVIEMLLSQHRGDSDYIKQRMDELKGQLVVLQVE